MSLLVGRVAGRIGTIQGRVTAGGSLIGLRLSAFSLRLRNTGLGLIGVGLRLPCIGRILQGVGIGLGGIGLDLGINRITLRGIGLGLSLFLLDLRFGGIGSGLMVIRTCLFTLE